MAHEKPTLTIRNRLKTQPLTFELTHDAVCLKAGECTCTRQLVGWREHDPKTGERHVRGSRKRVGKSITLLARGTPGGGDIIDGLPMSVGQLPDIVASKARGDIVVEETDPKEAAKRAEAMKPKPKADEKPADEAGAAEAASGEGTGADAAPQKSSALKRAKE